MTVTDGDGNQATINANAFQWATGNVGANVASGDGNQQANSAYLDHGSHLLSLTTGTSQTSNYNSVSDSDGQKASVAGSAFANAKGNIGVNVAAGNLNQQSNAAVILSQDQLSGLVASTQQSQYGDNYSNADDHNANITGSAFESASGNIGVNVAAGNGNQQANSLVVNANCTPCSGSGSGDL
ncbi:MAG: hypothetical protein ACYDEK_07085 [Vulcanimicrobiaceae bacterium]